MKLPTFKKCGVDADIVAYRASCATQEKPFSECEDSIEGLMGYIVDQTVSFQTESNLSVYLTGKDNFRLSIAKTYPYKGTRKSEKPKHLQDARDYLVEFWGAEITQGYEADDALGIEATAYGEDYIIASIDKDLLTIPGWHFNFVKGVHIHKEPLDSLKFFYQQCMTGDKVDNIIGLHRVGPVTADKALEGLTDEVDMFNAALDMYKEKCVDGDPYERLVENAKLLHMLRYEDVLWEPPEGSNVL